MAARTTGDAKAQAAFRLLLDFDSDNDNLPNAAPLGEAAPHRWRWRLQGVCHGMTAKKKRANWYAAPCCSNTARAHGRTHRRPGHQHGPPGAALHAVAGRAPRDGWSFGEEEGYIDGRRLAQLISSPSERRLFRKEQFLPQADCLVTFSSIAPAP
jgi:cobaltochelatase CobT